MLITDFAALAPEGDWTLAFRRGAEALERQGGGELLVPPGLYPTGPIRLGSHMALRLMAGATLRFSDRPDAFPLIDGEFEGMPAKQHVACVYAADACHVSILGEGTLDGNGGAWWRAKQDGSLAHPRPYLVHFERCEHVTLQGVTLVNSPCWTVHPQYCRDVSVTGVRILNPKDSPNTDGINPNGCSHVRITGCFIDVGDDCIAIKAGTEDTPCPRPCEHIVISGCSMAHGHGGVVIGSEMSGCVRNVLVTGCVFSHTDRGIRIKTRRGRGGAVENVQVSGVLMDDVACPLVINLYYHCGKGGRSGRVRSPEAMPVDGGTPSVRDISLSDVRVRGATVCAAYLHGLPESPIRRVTLRNVTIQMSPGSPGVPAMLDDAPTLEAAGIIARHTEDFVCEGVQVIGAV